MTASVEISSDHSEAARTPTTTEAALADCYLDDYGRRNGEWKIMERREVFDMCSIYPTESVDLGDGMTSMGAGPGKRDLTDPSYSTAL